eukprot:TRINITY_DN6952_c0_g1_i1.p1 TRINITY_DN6952_c0_g1~~TRINITY_DN6952_c0_g1_i1.p1  ORF type:complete len:103 (-),score=15.89 TRINITY_DN6952_c0_g1_i1:197-505(-)
MLVMPFGNKEVKATADKTKVVGAIEKLANSGLEHTDLHWRHVVSIDGQIVLLDTTQAKQISGDDEKAQSKTKMERDLYPKRPVILATKSPSSSHPKKSLIVP